MKLKEKRVNIETAREVETIEEIRKSMMNKENSIEQVMEKLQIGEEQKMRLETMIDQYFEKVEKEGERLKSIMIGTIKHL